MADSGLLDLALEMGVNPTEIETWDIYDVNRLLAVMQAKAMARSL